jgi:hypothetical protein
MYLMAKLRYVLHRSYAELTEISNHKVGYCILGELIGNGEGSILYWLLMGLSIAKVGWI